jgi:hypothetical protein
MPCTDTIADVITRHHLLRLVSARDSDGRRRLTQEMRRSLDEQVEKAGLDAELFHRIDRMTQLCDTISFYFCREEPSQGRVEVWPDYAGTKATYVEYRVSGSDISLDPWPLSSEAYEGYILGYRAEGYPQRVDGLIVPYVVRRAGTRSTD